NLTARVHLGLLRLRLDELAASGPRLHVHIWGEAVDLGDASPEAERDAGKRVAALYTMCFAHPRVDAIFWNGLADSDANARGGGLLRADFAPKYAYRALHKLIHSTWHTRAAGVSDGEGLFHFRGFFGDYRVGVSLGDDAVQVSSFTLERENS